MAFSKIVAAGLLASVSVVALPVAAKPAATQAADPLAGLDVDVPAKKFVLKNGLTLIVHEDKSAPLVAVNVTYHVGSKDEPKGRSGFAHLFEHLMFNGSEHFNDDFFKATRKIGASEQNGTTDTDITSYYQTVPKAALDTILWLESDRMGHLLGAIDQAKLDEQRAVVKNEKRESENRPYGKFFDLVMKGTIPPDHPYGHSVIGSMEDLDAASLEDVKQWFRDYYGPSNAVLALSGDITPEEALAKVEKYFGSFAPGAPVSRLKSWTPKRAGTVREVTYDRVAQPTITRVWNVPGMDGDDTSALQLLSEVLTNDRNARLYKRLVIDEQVATMVRASVKFNEISGQFTIDATLKPGRDIAAVERAIDEELRKLLETGPTPAELARVRNPYASALMQSLELISFKAKLLAESQTFSGSPNKWKEGWLTYRDTKPADVARAGKVWLTDGDYILHTLPFGQLAAAGADADRSKVPEAGDMVPATFPAVERATFANGMKLVVARRPNVPIVHMSMALDTGVPADFAAIPNGAEIFALRLLTEGTKTRSLEELENRLNTISASVTAEQDDEQSSVNLTAMKPTLREAIAIYADNILNPAYRAEDLERVKGEMIARIASYREDGASAAERLFPMLMYGKDMPYGRMLVEAEVASLKPADLSTFHQRWFRPNNATLIVVGDTSLAEIRPLVEAAFAGWQPAKVPERIVPVAPPAASSVVYLIDSPGASQSAILAAAIAPKRADGDEIARKLFNTAVGGDFTSRLNMKLREEKGWAYGASSEVSGGRGSRLFTAKVSAQTDKTADSMTEIATILTDALGGKPVSDAELAGAKDTMGLGLSSMWSDNEGIMGALVDEVSAGLPQSYYQSYAQKIAAADLASVNAAGADMLKGKPLTWVVAGDLSKIEAPIRALGIGEVRVIDADGNLLR